MSSSGTTVGAFEVLRVTDPADAAPLAAEVALMFKQRLDHMSSHVYVSVDGTAVVHCGEWTTDRLPDTNPGADLLRALSTEFQVEQNFLGRLLVSIDGAAAPEPPGVAVLATRHVK